MTSGFKAVCARAPTPPPIQPRHRTKTGSKSPQPRESAAGRRQSQRRWRRQATSAPAAVAAPSPPYSAAASRRPPARGGASPLLPPFARPPPQLPLAPLSAPQTVGLSVAPRSPPLSPGDTEGAAEETQRALPGAAAAPQRALLKHRGRCRAPRQRSAEATLHKRRPTRAAAGRHTFRICPVFRTNLSGKPDKQFLPCIYVLRGRWENVKLLRCSAL